MTASALITIADTPVTMTSLEMVDFINTRREAQAIDAGERFPSRAFAKLAHADFMKKVPEVLGACAGNFSGTYQVTGPRGGVRNERCYIFPKREAALMAMSYSYEIQAAVWDHMTMLEGQSQNFDPMKALSDPATMRSLLLGYTEKVIELEDKVTDLAPKAAALEQISASSEALTVTQAAKVLGVKVDELTTFMNAKGWIYRQNGSWVAYEKHIRTGDLKYKEARYTDDTTKQEVRRPYCHILPKGLTKLARLMNGSKEAA